MRCRRRRVGGAKSRSASSRALCGRREERVGIEAGLREAREVARLQELEEARSRRGRPRAGGLAQGACASSAVVCGRTSVPRRAASAPRSVSATMSAHSRDAPFARVRLCRRERLSRALERRERPRSRSTPPPAHDRAMTTASDREQAANGERERPVPPRRGISDAVARMSRMSTRAGGHDRTPRDLKNPMSGPR